MFSRRDPDFDWTTDDSVVLEKRSALAVYVNSRGEVVLRMQGDWDEDVDHFVCFPENDAEYVAHRILALVKGQPLPWTAPRHDRLSEGDRTPSEQPKQLGAAPDLFAEKGGSDA
jgi:hypothetical protein